MSQGASYATYAGSLQSTLLSVCTLLKHGKQNVAQVLVPLPLHLSRAPGVCWSSHSHLGNKQVNERSLTVFQTSIEKTSIPMLKCPGLPPTPDSSFRLLQTLEDSSDSTSYWLLPMWETRTEFLASGFGSD